jgi:hypothetical protein
MDDREASVAVKGFSQKVFGSTSLSIVYSLIKPQKAPYWILIEWLIVSKCKIKSLRSHPRASERAVLLSCFQNEYILIK